MNFEYERLNDDDPPPRSLQLALNVATADVEIVAHKETLTARAKRLYEKIGGKNAVMGVVDLGLDVAREFWGGPVVKVLKLVIQQGEDMAVAHRGWGELLDTMLSSIEEIIKRAEENGLGDFAGVQSMREGVEFVLTEAPKYLQANCFRRFLRGRWNKKRMKRVQAKFTNAKQDFNLHMVGNLCTRDANPKQYVLNGHVPDVPNWFVKRGHLQKSIKANLLRESVRCVALEGMTGIGKSTLASHLVQVDEDVKDYYDGGVHWIYVGKEDSNDITKDVLIELHAMLHVPTPEGSDASTSEMQVEDLRCQVTSAVQGKNCLVVLDGIGEKHMHLLDDFHTMGVKVLATMRGSVPYSNREWLSWWHMERMDSEEALAIFNLVSNSTDVQSAHAKRLIAGCHGLPLALVMTGHYFQNKVASNGGVVPKFDPRERPSYETAHSHHVNDQVMLGILNICIERTINCLGSQNRKALSLICEAGYGKFKSESQIRYLGHLEHQSRISCLESWYLLYGGKRYDQNKPYNKEKGWGVHDVVLDYMQFRNQ